MNEIKELVKVAKIIGIFVDAVPFSIVCLFILYHVFLSLSSSLSFLLSLSLSHCCVGVFLFLKCQKWQNENLSSSPVKFSKPPHSLFMFMWRWMEKVYQHKYAKRQKPHKATNGKILVNENFWWFSYCSSAFSFEKVRRERIFSERVNWKEQGQKKLG